MNLYPLKFIPIIKPKIWGEESWQLSALGDAVSVVANGYLQGNDLNDLLEVYMGELVGEHVFEQYGHHFPLLFKFIDTKENLSVQVHPGDEVAWERHHASGKDEMWYVADCKPKAQLILGFSQEVTPEILLKSLQEKRINSLLNKVEVRPDDVAFIPSGLVHALRENVYVAEIQQASDITYRLHDYDRLDAHGMPRELHVNQALEVLNYGRHAQPLVDYVVPHDAAVNLVTCTHFTTNLLAFQKKIGRDYAPLDSFVGYMCVKGSLIVESDDCQVDLSAGETMLLPAVTDEVFLQPHTQEVRLLEVYIP